MAAVRASGGSVVYDYQLVGGKKDLSAKPPGPSWMVMLLGEDYFAVVVQASAGGEGFDYRRLAELNHLNEVEIYPEGAELNEELGCLKDLAELECLVIRGEQLTGLAGLSHIRSLKTLVLHAAAKIDDKELHHLWKLENLRLAGLGNAGVTENGIELLQRALPDCEVRWLNPASGALARFAPQATRARSRPTAR
ncbi:MAG TPA: hypothetical protein VMV10_33050 [Pirellulales bacterium]|nr:hypothetical protein [Pirellulales bacterium]